MANRWGKKTETMTDFIFLGSKITVEGDRSHQVKRCLLLGIKVMTNLDSVLKGRHITLTTKIHTVKSYVFSSSHVQMWELDHKEGWAPKNWRFWTAVLEKTLESLLDSKIKPVNPKEINSEYSLDGLMLKLKLQYFGQLMQRADSLEKTPM